LISDTDSSSYYSVEETLKIFKKQFPQYQIASLHGQMPDAQKRDILFKFKSKDIDILISTTVIEVGIHVDDATSMVIMNANAFGLAQLHQLRGRIGRNDLQSYCFLVVDESVEDIDRLSILEKEDDGFKISAYDLRLRGPGEVFGKHQAGIPNFHFVNIIEDSDLLKKALSDARLLIDANDELSNQLKNQVIQTIESYHLD
jgi:ATP-dependent DNA helicase RecG